MAIRISDLPLSKRPREGYVIREVETKKDLEDWAAAVRFCLFFGCR
jgi:hypothetical protein